MSGWPFIFNQHIDSIIGTSTPNNMFQDKLTICELSVSITFVNLRIALDRSYGIIYGRLFSDLKIYKYKCIRKSFEVHRVNYITWVPKFPIVFSVEALFEINALRCHHQ